MTIVGGFEEYGTDERERTVRESIADSLDRTADQWAHSPHGSLSIDPAGVIRLVADWIREETV